MSTGPVTLVILDGWGLSSSPDNNAACIAKTPVYDRLRAEYPKSLLSTSGEDVGLPAGQMGNSEVGHLNIGAGRIVYQDLSRIGRAIEDGSFFDNAALKQACEKVVASGGKLHLLGLLSDGGVHSHNTHIYALIRMAAQMGVKDVCVHAFMDGRDTSPKNGVGYLAELEQQMQELGCGRVASISGRYFAMDRDNRWERVEKAYRAVTEAKGEQFDSSAAAIEAAYADDQTDEFVIPRVVGGGAPFAANDGVIFFNFRADRAREMTRALTLDDFDGFDRGAKPQLVEYVCLTEYDETFDLPVAYPAESYPEILAEVVSKAGKKQLRIAETEKYAHVTFFFNGGVEKPWPGEERLLVQSPQDVATYDLKPEMSAYQIAETVTKRIKEEHYDFIVINFANCDMVGHTGVLDAAVAAVEAVDTCLGKVVETVLEAGGKLLITADHGNCEQMVDAQGRPHTAHTTNPVEFVYVDDSNKDAQVTDGILADLAPTAVELLGLQQPEVMTGTSLIKH